MMSNIELMKEWLLMENDEVKHTGTKGIYEYFDVYESYEDITYSMRAYHDVNESKEEYLHFEVNRNGWRDAGSYFIVGPQKW